MSSDSPVAILYNSNGIELGVSGGVLVPVSTSAFLNAGIDSSGIARVLKTTNNGTLFVTGTVDTSFASTINVQVVNTASVNINGTPNVSITGVPAVNLANTASVNVQNFPSTQNVQIVNTASVNANVNITASIALPVSLSNNPTVQVGNFPSSQIVIVQNTASVNINGTPSVSVTGVPAVNLANTASVNVQNFPSTQNVQVINTASVNINGIPAVNLANTASVNVQGTVTVTDSMLAAIVAGTSSIAPVSGVLIGGKNASGSLRPLAVDNNGIFINGQPDFGVGVGRVSGVSGHLGGFATTAAATLTAIRSTTYTEQTSSAQRSVYCESAQDTSAGAYARTAILTYYDSNMNGPYTEIFTLNGGTNVNSVNTNIHYIENFRVHTVGASGSNQDVIYLYSGPNREGSLVASIPNNATNTTNWAHHYVKSGSTCFVKNVVVTAQSNNFLLYIKSKDLSTTSSAERLIGSPHRIIAGSIQNLFFDNTIAISGPARLTFYCLPDGGGAQTIYLGFSIFEVAN